MQYVSKVDVESEEYSYAPLSNEALEIRLLVLLPGDEWTPIRCELRTALLPDRNEKNQGSLPQIPLYTGLSYTWGSLDLAGSLFLEGKKMEVRTNLLTALRYLRSKTNNTVLWVDALWYPHFHNISLFSSKELRAHGYLGC